MSSAATSTTGFRRVENEIIVMSSAPKPTVANYREFKEYPKIEKAYSTHLLVVGKRNPFAEPEAWAPSCDEKTETNPRGPLA